MDLAPYVVNHEDFGCFLLLVEAKSALCWMVPRHLMIYPSLKLTKTNPENRPCDPKGKFHLPTIRFQGQVVFFGDGKS